RSKCCIRGDALHNDGGNISNYQSVRISQENSARSALGGQSADAPLEVVCGGSNLTAGRQAGGGRCKIGVGIPVVEDRAGERGKSDGTGSGVEPAQQNI